MDTFRPYKTAARTTSRQRKTDIQDTGRRTRAPAFDLVHVGEIRFQRGIDLASLHLHIGHVTIRRGNKKSSPPNRRYCDVKLTQLRPTSPHIPSPYVLRRLFRHRRRRRRRLSHCRRWSRPVHERPRGGLVVRSFRGSGRRSTAY